MSHHTHIDPKEIDREVDYLLSCGVEELERADELAPLTQGDSLLDAQHPDWAIKSCTDSRSNLRAILAITTVGKVLVIRDPGAIMSRPEKFVKRQRVRSARLSTRDQQCVDLALNKNVKAFILAPHGGCGAEAEIYAYHTTLKSYTSGTAEEKEIAAKTLFTMAKKEPGFVRKAKGRTSLYQTVKQNSLNHYKMMGVELVGNENEQFIQALAIQQGLWDFEVLVNYGEKRKQAIDKTMRDAGHESHTTRTRFILAFQNIPGCATYRYYPEENIFKRVAKIDHSPFVDQASRPTDGTKCGCEGCGCGLGDKK